MRLKVRTIITTMFLSFFFLGGLGFAQAPPRYFDTATVTHDGTRLTICYPSVGTLRALVSLKNQGLLSTDGLEVIGIYHAKEKTDYRAALKFVQDQKITWVKFHEVTAELDPGNLFKTSAVSREFADIFRKSDGVIFFGGPDIPPATYREKTSLLTQITDPFRHYFELSFVFHLLGGSQDDAFKPFLDGRPNFPVLGICLGMQTLNAGTGGTLVQDIWAETYGKMTVEDILEMGPSYWHTNPWTLLAPTDRTLFPHMMHPIKLVEQSKFCANLGFKPTDEPYIMSAHHQAARVIGKGFRVAATSLDGKVIEAIEHTRFPNVLGLQFHPEFPVIWDTTPKYKLTPKDKDLIAINAYLTARPPTIEFHKKLWTWFFNVVRQHH
jgi:putative glutamine amidotransferase